MREQAGSASGFAADRLRTNGISALAVILVAAMGVTGCGLLFPGPPTTSQGQGEERTVSDPPSESLSPPVDQIPIGLGTLRQEEISIALRRAEVEMQITPLDESVIRLTAPDTYDRLAALSRGLQEIFREETGSAVPFQLFLVSLYSEMTESTFEPSDLTLVNRGIRYRPVQIRPLSPGWDTRILRPRQPLLAVYAFPGEIDLDRPIEVEYREVRSFDWDRIIPLIDAERSRLRGRSSAGD
jgi:hypothetical protein